MSGPRLEDRVIVVTGGASGIGRACALRFASEGARIVIADLGEDRCREAAEAITAETGRAAVGVVTDVSDEASIEAMADAALAAFGRIDGLVAAAGVSSASYVSGQQAQAVVDRSERFLTKRSVADWNRVLTINTTGVWLSGRAVANRMLAAGHGGSIVNIASVAARVPLAGAGDYCVSKAGVEMITKVMGLELADTGIRVNAIGPGFIETPMTRTMRETNEGMTMMLEMTPMGRPQPEEIANTALFLLSDESSYFTGQILFPNGGMRTG